MNVRQFARDALRICESFGISDPWLVSQSLGGRIGVELVRNAPPALRVRGLFAFAPPWRLRRAPIKGLPRTLRGSVQLINRMGKLAGRHGSRIPARLPYATMRDMPDFHMPVMIDEVRSLGWRRYARLLLGMKLADFRRDGGWEVESDCPIHIYAARQDRLINNDELERLSEHAGLPLHWIDCWHVSLMTNDEHARAFADSVCDEIQKIDTR